ncbi:MAG: rod-binding protein [Pirellulales bacterium]|nr:rod-binding protein [Pirellulales bacterium]
MNAIATPNGVCSTALHQQARDTSLARELNRATSLTQPAEQLDEKEIKNTFQSVLGELLFGQMLKSMRTTVGKAAYFNGGRAEEVFTQQLDQVLAQHMSQAAAEPIVEPMYELFMLQRQ